MGGEEASVCGVGIEDDRECGGGGLAHGFMVVIAGAVLACWGGGGGKMTTGVPGGGRLHVGDGSRGSGGECVMG